MRFTLTTVQVKHLRFPPILDQKSSKKSDFRTHVILDSNGTTTSKHVLINDLTETSINQSPLRLSDEKQTFGRSRVPRTDLSIRQKNIYALSGDGERSWIPGQSYLY